jgi:parvulin-like peptidyl-prolyl isomerase
MTMKNLKALLITGILVFIPTLASAETVEAIIARVGDRIITRSQYLGRLRAEYVEIERTVEPAAVAARKEAVRKNLLHEMLSEVLIKDRADRLGLSVTPAELQEAVKRLKAQYGIETDEAFNDSLQKSGLSRAEMEARLRDTLLTNKVFSRELKSRDELTDRELRERYEREKEHYRLPERARVREIVVVATDPADLASRERLKSRAMEAYERAKRGEDFLTLVAEYSDAPTKEKGGDLGEVARGELLPVLDSGVFSSDAGAVLGPIETRFGFHILNVNQRIPAEIPSFDAVKDRLRREASEETFQRDYQAYIERLRKEAFVEIYEQNLPTA